VKATPSLRASHVNSGTAIADEDLAWPDTTGRVMRLRKTHVEVDRRATVTPYGGLALAAAFVRRFRVAERLDESVHVFKRHAPYHESDHILAQVFNLYVGGSCIEDQASLQHDPGVLAMVGACRLPDPTTAGDFLRRFDEARNPGSLAALRQCGDALQSAVWRKLRRRHAASSPSASHAVFVDLDGHRKRLYGVQKEGADFSHKGEWSYYPLLVSLAETGEALAIRNRAGNESAHVGADAVLDEVLPRVQALGRTIVVRGDSEFDQRTLRAACERHGAHFAFVGREFKDRPRIAQSIPEHQWQPFRTRAARERAARRTVEPRRRQPNRRKQRARDRGYQDLRLVRQWVAEVPWQPRGSSRTYRLVIRRQLLEHSKGQQVLFEDYRYRYVVTDLPRSWSTGEVIDATYQRCDQENVIAQMGSGLAMWRMPVGEFAGNSAWLEIARLAWNLGKWIAQLVLPAEVVRWEWKRFRQAYVYLAAQVVRRANQVWLRLSGSHRFTASWVAAHSRLQT
jgi:hypothetical protein